MSGFSTIIEPFRIKVVEQIKLTTQEEREAMIREAGYNIFSLRSEDVIVDLLTDSGTGAMSANQWAGVMRGDESYAGSPSYFRFRDSIADVTGFEHIIPTHQGRAAERILFSVMCNAGDVVPNNSHFDTTRAHVEYRGALAVDLPSPELADMDSDYPFKGEMDVEALRAAFAEHGADRIPLVMLTVTNNSGGGQPVSMANAKAVADVCREFGKPLYLDACRITENAFLIKQREPGYADMSVREIVRELCDLAEGCTMSAKKDAIVNMGGFLATRDAALAQEERVLLILSEGFPTYGGLSGRDLEALAIGMQEAVDEDYLNYRIASTQYVGRHLRAAGVPLLWPPGGHAIYLDAKRIAAHVAPTSFPGVSVANRLYELGGVRACEIGTLMFGSHDPDTGQETAGPRELVRLAIPRRTYTQSHMDYVIEVVLKMFEERESLPGYRILEQAPFLRHFSARLEPIV